MVVAVEDMTTKTTTMMMMKDFQEMCNFICDQVSWHVEVVATVDYRN